MIIFLDIDGVLNGHKRAKNGYCGIEPECVKPFNAILQSTPETKIVISSAWRYMISRGAMTSKGFEYLLLTNGVDCENRVIGHTEEDLGELPTHPHDPAWTTIGLRLRAGQIRTYIRENRIQKFVVIDDLPLEIDNLVRTDGSRGLEWHQAAKAILILQGKYYET